MPSPPRTHTKNAKFGSSGETLPGLQGGVIHATKASLSSSTNKNAPFECKLGTSRNSYAPKLSCQSKNFMILHACQFLFFDPTPPSHLRTCSGLWPALMIYIADLLAASPACRYPTCMQAGLISPKHRHRSKGPESRPASWDRCGLSPIALRTFGSHIKMMRQRHKLARRRATSCLTSVPTAKRTTSRRRGVENDRPTR